MANHSKSSLSFWCSALVLAGHASAALAQLAVSSRTLDFGTVTNTSTSITRTWTVTNTGRTNYQLPPFPVYVFKSVAGTPTESGSFFVNGGSCTPGLILKSAQSCNFVLAFQPRGLGNKAATFSINKPDFQLPVTLSGNRIEPSEYATSGYGGSRTSPAKSVEDLVANRSATTSGYFWFDPDGAAGRPPFLAYAELTTPVPGGETGGWMLVRRIAKGTVWFPLNDNLSGAGWNTDENGFVDAYAGVPLGPTTTKTASLQFDTLLNANTQFLFAAVNSAGKPIIYCAIARGTDGRFGGSASSSLQGATVLAKSGTAVPVGQKTNVIFGSVFGAPWIGCEGSFTANQSGMLYGEDGATTYPTLLNGAAYAGINVYIRKITTAVR